MIDKILIKGEYASPTYIYAKTESPESGLFLYSISGISPADGTINSEEYASIDGEVFTGSKIGKREITMKIMPIPSSSTGIVALRKNIYKIFQLKSKTKVIIFQDEAPTRLLTEAYVEKVSPNIFSKQEIIEVNLIAMSPFMLDVSHQTAAPSFSSDISSAVTRSFTGGGRGEGHSVGFYDGNWYSGDFSCGFRVVLKANQSLTLADDLYFRIYDHTGTWTSLKMLKSRGATIDSSKYLILDTYNGQRKLFTATSPTATSGTNCLSWIDIDNSTWPLLDVNCYGHNITNALHFSSQTDGFVQGSFDLTNSKVYYYNTYLGV